MTIQPRLLLALLLITGFTGLTGCAALGEYDESRWSAEKYYSMAKEAMDRDDFLSALDLFNRMEARYPYGEYAEQAQLDVIYAHYKADEPDAAIAAAERFIKLNPRHKHVDYAYYMRGVASFAQGRGLFEYFSEKDPAEHETLGARTAYHHFEELARRFPDSKYRNDAIQRMIYLRNMLSRHELKVAEYQMKRGSYLGAANRAKYVVENYPRTPSVAPALQLMVEAYHRLGLDDLSADAARVLALNFPQGAGLSPSAQDNNGSEVGDTPSAPVPPQE